MRRRLLTSSPPRCSVMKILIISTYGFDPAFPSRPEYVQARALVRRGHRVVAYEYYAPQYSGQATRHAWLPGNVAVHRGATWGFFAPELLLRLLLAEQPDVVHIHHLRNLLAFQTVRLAHWLRVPVVLTPHGLLHDGDLVLDRDRPLEAPPRFERLIMRPQQLAYRLLRGAHPRRAVRNYLIHAPLHMVDSAVALSEHEHDLLITLGVAPERITVLPNAVDLADFERLSAQSNTVQLPPVPSPHILFIGQLIERKGFDLLAHAMPAVVQAFPQATFTFVSHYRRGEAELQRIVAAGGVERNLRLLGAVDELAKTRLLHMADVVVAPSRYEGFGIPLIEAMAAGRPVITTDVPASNEVVQHERTGLLVPYDDPDALAAAIIRLLRDPELAQRLGQQGRHVVESHYNAEYLAARLEEWYRAIKNEQRGLSPL